MRTAALLLSLIAVSWACKCKEQTARESFCNADWVSHMKVKVRMTKQGLPSDSSRKGLNNIRYAVQHLNVYKSPASLQTLPVEIYTPSEAPACGLVLDAGKEYLLAGRIDGSVLYTVLCGQILPDDANRDKFENVLEWSSVPKNLASSLEKMTC